MASATLLANRPVNFDPQRQSANSTTSYATARSSQNPPHLSSSPSSSPQHTLGRNPDVNPIHTLARQSGNGVHSQELHIVKVTNDAVHIEPGPVSDSFVRKVGKTLTHVVTSAPLDEGDDHPVGPPPPSPPASVDHDDGGDGFMPLPPSMKPSRSEPGPYHSTSFDASERYSTTSRDSRQFPRSSIPSHPGPSHDFVGRPSMETNATGTISSSTRETRLSNRSDDTTTQQSMDTPFTESGSQVSKSLNAAHLSSDGYLQPPPVSMHPARRNTTGSTPKLARPALYPPGSSTNAPGFDEGAVEGELESDIQLQAEQIRRERLSRRKAQQDAELAMTKTSSGSRGGKKIEEAHVLVGNLIGEDHVNYVLMYNMLTGIRIGVSRCQAKIKRPLKDEDFTARHKFSFDIVGNELTPSAKYDFKFKDYAPWVFRELREDYFHLDPADYLLSLTAKYILSELGSPGKSGSFFYFSRDYRFIIKTIHHSEHKFLMSILKDYHAHVKNNPHTLLSRFYGLHRVKLPHGRKIHFVIMNNLFPPHRDVHETYDLKGSTVGREYSEEKAAQNPGAVMKDLNWINRGKMLELGPEKRALLQEQLRRDSELLKAVNVMDYSLLVGIHNMQRGNRDNVRSNTLKVFSPDVPRIRRKPTQIKGSTSPEAIAMRRAMRESDPKRLDAAGTFKLPEEDTGDRQEFIFYQDEGGMRATDEENQPMDTIYYLGVIDILTPYTFLKKCEHFWKGLSADRHKISPVQPVEYADRFFSFMRAIMRGGEGGARFKSE